MSTLDDRVIREVIEPAGGFDKFRLVVIRANGDRLIQYSDGLGFIGLILEEDELEQAAIALLSRHGVPTLIK